MANPLILAHVQARFPRLLTPDEERMATAYITDVWQLLLERRSTIEDDMSTTVPLPEGKVAQATVVRVLAESVVRKLLNPERKLEESIDDYRFKRDAGTGELYLTSGEIGDLTPPSITGSRNSIRLVAYGES